LGNRFQSSFPTLKLGKKELGKGHLSNLHFRDYTSDDLSSQTDEPLSILIFRAFMKLIEILMTVTGQAVKALIQTPRLQQATGHNAGETGGRFAQAQEAG